MLLSKKNAKPPSPVPILGLSFLLIGLALLVWIFFPAAKEEVSYQVKEIKKTTPQIIPVNKDFSLVVPEIYANAPIVADVDPLDSAIYQRALAKGVAHALGTGKPGEGKNIFLFAHSSADLLTATRYNSVFYLLHKLEEGSLISVWYQGSEYKYQVNSVKYVSSSSIEYLRDPGNEETLTLMTCWPPGTTFKRLIVQADLVL